MESVAPYFHMKFEDASRSSGMSPTSFKKCTRKLGIKKWPYRKIHALSKAIDKHQQLKSTLSPESQISCDHVIHALQDIMNRLYENPNLDCRRLLPQFSETTDLIQRFETYGSIVVPSNDDEEENKEPRNYGEVSLSADLLPIPLLPRPIRGESISSKYSHEFNPEGLIPVNSHEAPFHLDSTTTNLSTGITFVAMTPPNQMIQPRHSPPRMTQKRLQCMDSHTTNEQLGGERPPKRRKISRTFSVHESLMGTRLFGDPMECKSPW